MQLMRCIIGTICAALKALLASCHFDGHMYMLKLFHFVWILHLVLCFTLCCLLGYS